jgi:NADPH:quinone reductase-like Zn-dependent oxidoreductase
MRAAFIRSWGAPSDVVEIGEFDEPLLGPDGVLVEVAAAGVNPLDWKIVGGGLLSAYPCHLPLIPGWDVAGRVIATGPAVISVQVGDRVAAYARKDHIQFGTFAERVAVPERSVARVPGRVDLEHAAALPLAGLTAEQLLDAAEVRGGDVVLIHAATGGVGSFAAQLAHLRGASVIGTASAVNQETLKERGLLPVNYADDLVGEVLSHAPGGVTAVIDLVGGEALAATPRVLVPQGRLASAIDPVMVKELSDAHGYQGRYVFVRPDSAMLWNLLELTSNGQVKVEVAARYGLDDTAAALEANRTGRTRGKIVITVAE